MMKTTTSATCALLLPLALVLAPAARGQSFNVPAGDWLNPLNWDPVGVPGAADHALLGSAGGQVANLSGGTTVVGQLNISPAAGQSGTLNIANGAHMTSGQGNSGGILIGSEGTGILNLSSGARLDSLISIVGDQASGTGVAHLTGTDTLWTPLSLYVGLQGHGTLIIDGGARVEVAGVTMANEGGAAKGDLHLNGSPGSRGVLQITNRIFNSNGGGAGTSTVYFDGGLLRSSASGPIFTDFEDGNIKIGAGGAFFSSQGGTIDVEMQGIGGLTKLDPGTLQLTGSQTYQGETQALGGRLLVDGFLQGGGGARATDTGVLGGSGLISGDIVIESGGIISPGGSLIGPAPGRLWGADNLEWQGGGSYYWMINHPEASQGSDPGWNHLQIDGDLRILADELDPFTIDLFSLTAANSLGELTAWDPTMDQRWIILTAVGDIDGFDPAAFTIDLTFFEAYNDLNGGSFHLDTVIIPPGPASLGESRLMLNFVVPEPSALLLLSAGLAPLLGLRRGK